MHVQKQAPARCVCFLFAWECRLFGQAAFEHDAKLAVDSAPITDRLRPFPRSFKSGQVQGLEQRPASTSSFRSRRCRWRRRPCAHRTKSPGLLRRQACGWRHCRELSIMDGVDEQHRIDAFQRAILPFLDLRQELVRHVGDEVFRGLEAVDVHERVRNLAGRHPLGVQGPRFLFRRDSTLRA